jgi:transposase
VRPRRYLIKPEQVVAMKSLLDDGKTMKQAARMLGVSYNSVKRHAGNYRPASLKAQVEPIPQSAPLSELTPSPMTSVDELLIIAQEASDLALNLASQLIDIKKGLEALDMLSRSLDQIETLRKVTQTIAEKKAELQDEAIQRAMIVHSGR